MSLRLSASHHALRLSSSTNVVCAPLLRAPLALRAADVPSLSRASSSSSSSSSSQAKSPAQPSNEAPASSSTLLSGFAKLLGYNHNSATAIRSTNYYYDMLCNRHTKNENEFWFEECGLPQSFTSWFHITNLHIYLLTVRFRALPSPLGRYFNQQLINHFFIDAEQRLQAHTSQSRIVKQTLKDCLEQYHGSFLAYDEALVTKSDAVLAAALWRNVFAGAWAGSISAEGKRAPVGHKTLALTEADLEQQHADLKRLGISPNAAAQELSSSPPSSQGAEAQSDQVAEANQDPLGVLVEHAQFAVSLEKLVHWVRREIQRLDQLPDSVVAAGKLADRVSPTLNFTPISPESAQQSAAPKSSSS